MQNIIIIMSWKTFTIDGFEILLYLYACKYNIYLFFMYKLYKMIKQTGKENIYIVIENLRIKRIFFFFTNFA